MRTQAQAIAAGLTIDSHAAGRPQRVPYRIIEQFVAGQHAGFWMKKTEGELP